MDTELSFDKIPAVLQEVLLRLRRIEFFLSENKSVKNNDPDSRMNVKETADFLDCSASTIYGLVFRRQIPHEKKGRRLYFQKSELNEWLKKGRRATVDEVKSSV
ncbi:MAG TPA: helix-turn-helix domain-containing protein [Bacteroidales bacterium]|nr:helix-turn-helix domain-containing protein [Bacteroidales bacterium]